MHEKNIVVTSTERARVVLRRNILRTSVVSKIYSCWDLINVDGQEMSILLLSMLEVHSNRTVFPCNIPVGIALQCWTFRQEVLWRSHWSSPETYLQ